MAITRIVKSAKPESLPTDNGDGTYSMIVRVTPGIQEAPEVSGDQFEITIKFPTSVIFPLLQEIQAAASAEIVKRFPGA